MQAFLSSTARRVAFIAAAVLVTLLPLRLYRACIEQSITVDETFALMVSGHPYREIVELTSIDQHPPGFYFVLRAWESLGTMLHVAPALWWARLPNVAAWCALVLGCSIILGPRLRRWEAVFVTALACGGSAAGDVAHVAGIYAIPVTALTICFLLMFVDSSNETPPVRHLPGLLVYTALAVVALYSHLLSAPVLCIFAAAWAALVLRKPRRKHLLARWAVVHLAIALLFLPWALHLRHQLSAFSSDTRAWTTPATLLNLVRTFTVWYPFGALGEDVANIRWWHYMLGAASWAPFVVSFFAVAAKRKLDWPCAAGWLAIACATANIVLLWGVEKLGIAHTWHGPRYPVLTAPLWAFGIAACALHYGRNSRHGFVAAVVLCIPWFACSAIGQFTSIRQERHAGLAGWKVGVPGYPHRGDPVYVMPSGLIPYHEKELEELNPQPIERLLDRQTSATKVAILNLNPWPGTDRLSDVYLRALINSGVLADEHTSRKIPQTVMGYTLHWLMGFRPDAAAKFKTPGLQPPLPELPGNTVSAAFVQDQRLNDGWSAANPTTSFYVTRIVQPGGAVLRFSKPVRKGNYVLQFVGQLFAPAGTREHFKLEIPGESISQEFATVPGSVSLRVPVELHEDHSQLALEIAPPLSSNRARQRAELHVYFAWLETK
jgi:hypothetical protein